MYLENFIQRENNKQAVYYNKTSKETYQKEELMQRYASAGDV